MINNANAACSKKPAHIAYLALKRRMVLYEHKLEHENCAYTGSAAILSRPRMKLNAAMNFNFTSAVVLVLTCGLRDLQLPLRVRASSKCAF